MCFLLSSNQNYSILLTSTIWESNEITICIFIANWGAFPFLGFNSIQDLFESYLSWDESRAYHISLERGRIDKDSLRWKDDLDAQICSRKVVFLHKLLAAISRWVRVIHKHGIGTYCGLGGNTNVYQHLQSKLSRLKHFPFLIGFAQTERSVCVRLTTVVTAGNLILLHSTCLLCSVYCLFRFSFSWKCIPRW